MVERLTIKTEKPIQIPNVCLGSTTEYMTLNNNSACINKLGQLEDAMEKHNIDSIEVLEKILTYHENYPYAYSEKYMLDNRRLEQENQELKERIKKQVEWIENTKNKKENRGFEMQNLIKENTRQKQNNKNLMEIIRKIKRESANKGREKSEAENKAAKLQAEIRRFKSEQSEKIIDELNNINKFIDQNLMLCCVDNEEVIIARTHGYNEARDDIKTYINNKIKEVKGGQE